MGQQTPYPHTKKKPLRELLECCDGRLAGSKQTVISHNADLWYYSNMPF